jgi:hypothetical protein
VSSPHGRPAVRPRLRSSLRALHGGNRQGRRIAAHGLARRDRGRGRHGERIVRSGRCRLLRHGLGFRCGRLRPCGRFGRRDRGRRGRLRLLGSRRRHRSRVGGRRRRRRGPRRRGRRGPRCHGRRRRRRRCRPRREEPLRVEVAVRVARQPDAEVDVGHGPLRLTGHSERSDRVTFTRRGVPLHREGAEVDERDRVAVLGADRDGEAVRRHRAGKRDRA